MREFRIAISEDRVSARGPVFACVVEGDGVEPSAFTARVPACEGARHLMKHHGAQPDDRLMLVDAKTGQDRFGGRVGWLAERTILETAGGKTIPTFARWQPFHSEGKDFEGLDVDAAPAG